MRVTRAGFSTIELLIVMVLGGIVAAAIGGVLRRQQRFFTNAASLVEQRVSLRDATGILPGELRALSPIAGDVLAFSDSALEVRATIGAAVACDTVAGGGAIDLVPAQAASAQRLTAFATTPQSGDIALVYDSDASADLPRDSATTGWTRLDVASAATRMDVCATSPLIEPTGSTPAARLQLRFTAGTRIPPAVGPGAFVRGLRRVRYRFYRASTNDWFLGYSEWDGTAFGVVQPVSGPYSAYSRRGGSGLSLRYFDDSGGLVSSAADAARIARIEIVVRGTPGAGMSGSSRAYTDSQTGTVRVRNR
jgi:prepilin-type N-terminal cleavage/methylation domain-containing protein